MDNGFRSGEYESSKIELVQSYKVVNEETGEYKTKAMIASLEKLNASPLECVMVGDHHNDIIGAREKQATRSGIFFEKGRKVCNIYE